jgi:ComF family protein
MLAWADCADAVLRCVFAPACAACGGRLVRPLAGEVCRACWLGVVRPGRPMCVTCGDALAPAPAGPECPRCRAARPPVRLARSAARYDGSMRAIIHAFKYRRRRGLARALGRLVRHELCDIVACAEAAVPVPLHPLRALQRGFNQADDLAVALGLPVWRALVRVRHGPPQASLPAADRAANIRQAFRVTHLPIAGHWRGRRALRGATILLVDDVMTTGATMNECGRVLIECGVRTVIGVSVARRTATPPPPPPAPPRLSPPPRR